MPRMTERDEAPLAGKLTIRAGGRKVVLVKHAWESERHVLLKALVFGRYAERYPGLTVEPRFEHRYRPDLVALDGEGQPRFWAECGETGKHKLEALLRGFPETHLVIAKQVSTLAPYEGLLRAAMVGVRRTAEVELINFSRQAATFIRGDGEVRVPENGVEVVSLSAGDPETAGAAPRDADIRVPRNRAARRSVRRDRDVR